MQSQLTSTLEIEYHRGDDDRGNDEDDYDQKTMRNGRCINESWMEEAVLRGSIFRVTRGLSYSTFWALGEEVTAAQDEDPVDDGEDVVYEDALVLFLALKLERR